MITIPSAYRAFDTFEEWFGEGDEQDLWVRACDEGEDDDGRYSAYYAHAAKAYRDKWRKG